MSPDQFQIVQEERDEYLAALLAIKQSLPEIRFNRCVNVYTNLEGRVLSEEPVDPVSVIAEIHRLIEQANL